MTEGSEGAASYSIQSWQTMKVDIKPHNSRNEVLVMQRQKSIRKQVKETETIGIKNLPIKEGRLTQVPIYEWKEGMVASKWRIEDRDSIMAGDRLNDLIINTGQRLLKNQFPKMKGLCSTLLQNKNK